MPDGLFAGPLLKALKNAEGVAKLWVERVNFLEQLLKLLPHDDAVPGEDRGSPSSSANKGARGGQGSKVHCRSTEVPGPRDQGVSPHGTPDAVNAAVPSGLRTDSSGLEGASSLPPSPDDSANASTAS